MRNPFHPVSGPSGKQPVERLALRYKWGAANVSGFSVAHTHFPLQSATNGDQFSGQLSAYLLTIRLFLTVSYNHFLGLSQKIHFEVRLDAKKTSLRFSHILGER